MWGGLAPLLEEVALASLKAADQCNMADALRGGESDGEEDSWDLLSSQLSQDSFVPPESMPWWADRIWAHAQLAPLGTARAPPRPLHIISGCTASFPEAVVLEA